MQDINLSRRHWIQQCGMGFGSLALANLLSSDSVGSSFSGAVPTHFPGTAKHIIHVFLNGGVSQVDTFDPKPELTKRAGQMLPYDNLQTERKTGVALPSPFRFQKHGESGIPISDLFPKLAQCADEMTVIRSMYAELPSHEMSLMLMNTGDQRLVRPSLGSWLTWGMGTVNENLPAFIALCPGGLPVGGAGNWRSAFLPGSFQGTRVDTLSQDPAKLIDFLKNKRLSAHEQGQQFALLQQFNQEHLANRPGEGAIQSRIESFELAYRMQMEASEAFDISQEPEHILRLYGDGPQNRQLLMARRLIERGVRFVQTWHGELQPWDSHSNIKDEHRKVANQCDSGLAALIIDLKQRGLLDQTLILCTGEFGRTPSVEMGQDGSGASQGRDHNHWGFSLWMAGGGIKRGMIYGATDDFGFRAVENRVSIHDLHATILHLMGYDHQRMTFRYAGRDFRLTDVHGSVIHPIIAS
jgi:hypothetical protein